MEPSQVRTRLSIRSAEHAHREKEPNYSASVSSELPPYAGGRPCLQGSTRSFRGAGGRARATYSCLPQLLTSSRSFLGSSAERRRGNRLSCGPAPRHRQGKPPASLTEGSEGIPLGQPASSTPSRVITAGREPRCYTKTEANEETASQMPHQSASEVSREMLQATAGLNGKLLSCSPRSGRDTRSCCR